MDSGTFRQSRKISQHSHPHRLTLFWMELRGKNVVPPNRRSKPQAVLGSAGNNLLVGRLRIIAMHEVGGASIRHSLKQWTFRLADFQLIPPNMRHFQRAAGRKTHHAPLENAQTGRAAVELAAPFKQNLIADANAEKPFSALNMIQNARPKPLLSESGNAVVKCPDPRQHHSQIARRKIFGIANQSNFCSGGDQGFMNAPKIPRPVVKQRNHRFTLEAKRPFVKAKIHANFWKSGKSAPAHIQKRMKKSAQFPTLPISTLHYVISNSARITVALNAQQPVILRPFPHSAILNKLSTQNCLSRHSQFPARQDPKTSTIPPSKASPSSPPQKKENFFHFSS